MSELKATANVEQSGACCRTMASMCGHAASLSLRNFASASLLLQLSCCCSYPAAVCACRSGLHQRCCMLHARLHPPTVSSVLLCSRHEIHCTG